jgi:excisionase family DNA binding protein
MSKFKDSKNRLEPKLNEFFELTIPISEVFLPTKKAIEYLGISKSQFYSLVKSGLLRSYKPTGKMIYCSLEDLNDFIRGGKPNDQNIAAESAEVICLQTRLKNRAA